MTTVHPILCPIPFPLKTVNCYYIADTRPTLIDASVDTPDSFDALSAAIGHAGGSISGLKRIILTHAHTDHAGMAGRLGRISGAEVFVHRWDAPKIVYGDREKTGEHLRRFRHFLERSGIPDAIARDMTDAFGRRLERLVSPIERLRTLSGGELFQFDDFQLRVTHTPGHSAGSVCLFNDVTRDVFVGDTLLEKITPNPVAETNLPRDLTTYGSIPHYLESLEKISRFGAEGVLPGHGAAFGHPGHRATALRQHFHRRRRLVLRIMERDAGRPSGEEGLTLYRLARHMFPNLKGLDLFLGLSESFAYVQLLETEGRIECRQTDRSLHFRLKR